MMIRDSVLIRGLRLCKAPRSAVDGRQALRREIRTQQQVRQQEMDMIPRIAGYLHYQNNCQYRNMARRHMEDISTSNSPQFNSPQFPQAKV
jgi:hypothetical protein